ncbi:hypothetical protein ABN306_04475 [Providencia huaxiensis]|uniref:hypothetical protein n=1 Tax=Providencia TaxID=586 RepID=UPI00234908FE|nr:hypothetical protein [Providencia sp. PROV032]
MKTKLIISAFFISALTPTFTHAFGNQHTWMSNKTQGVTEFVILGQGQSQLYLSCEDKGDKPIQIMFTDSNGHQTRMDTGQYLEMKFDGEETAQISESASRAGSSHLASAWYNLRTAKQVTVSSDEGESVTFTLNGAASVLPEFGDDGCLAEFFL